VHFTTVYRWWPTRPDLLREALTLHTASLVTPNQGSWAADVYELVHELARFISDPVEIAMNALMASSSEPEGNELQITHYGPVMLALSEIVDRAKQRGEVAPQTDPAIFMYLLVGPLFMHTVVFRTAPDPQVVREMATALTNSFASER
jgi:hypothetical protein